MCLCECCVCSVYAVRAECDGVPQLTELSVYIFQIRFDFMSNEFRVWSPVPSSSCSASLPEHTEAIFNWTCYKYNEYMHTTTITLMRDVQLELYCCYLLRHSLCIISLSVIRPSRWTYTRLMAAESPIVVSSWLWWWRSACLDATWRCDRK